MSRPRANRACQVDVAASGLCARRGRLQELRDGAFEDRLACQLEIAYDQHEMRDVIAIARELVNPNPFRESLRTLLICAHALGCDCLQRIATWTAHEPAASTPLNQHGALKNLRKVNTPALTDQKATRITSGLFYPRCACHFGTNRSYRLEQPFACIFLGVLQRSASGHQK
jgi:hypothetical protein